MPQATDLYSILRGYAYKNHSAYIDIEGFLGFLENYAARKAPEQPEWIKWATDAKPKFWADFPALAEKGKCVLLADTKEGRIYMPFFYHEQLLEAYTDIDKMADIPFPTEENLKMDIPEGNLCILSLSSDLEIFFDQPEDTGKQAGATPPYSTEGPDIWNPATIIKLLFPQDYGSALVTASMIPHQLMEIALVKIRYYLQNHNNKVHVLNKLIPRLQGKEKFLRQILDQIMLRPFDCLNDMERLVDFPYLFWTYFCPLIKDEIKRGNDYLNEDLAALQAVCIIEECSSFYRAKVAKKREVDIAFKTLEVRMEQSPWLYSLDDIVKFTTDKRIPLLEIYSNKELERYIQKNLTEGVDNELPPWFTVQGMGRGGRWFIKKEKYLPLCAQMLIEARQPVKKAVTSRWTKLLREFRTEPAMEKDIEFDRLLAVYTKSVNSTLAGILEDPRLFWVYEELDSVKGAVPPSSRIFQNGRLIPMNALYVIRRKDLLADARMHLPAWYSIPVLTAVFAFFKNFGTKKKKRGQVEYTVENDEKAVTGDKESSELLQSVRAVQAALVPQGKTLEECLSRLGARWSKLLNKKDRENLIIDVQSLVKDYLRRAMRVHKTKKITREGLSEMSTYLVASTPALQNLGDQESLHRYMELYMLKLLLSRR
ncbi:MAG: hypothetical protein LBD18_00620 [Treponema sp.]|jgi:hypothetical protein|nr:hypothetical protein [Treponema sp.]